MGPYSMDLRERVVAACDAREGSREQIAKRFGVSDRWIRKLLQQRRETGSIAPLPQNPGRKRALNDRQMERLRRLIHKRPDATLEELRKSLGVKISIAALHRAVRALDLTLKKVARGGGTEAPRRSRSTAALEAGDRRRGSVSPGFYR